MWFEVTNECNSSDICNHASGQRSQATYLALMDCVIHYMAAKYNIWVGEVDVTLAEATDGRMWGRDCGDLRRTWNAASRIEECPGWDRVKRLWIYSTHLCDRAEWPHASCRRHKKLTIITAVVVTCKIILPKLTLPHLLIDYLKHTTWSSASSREWYHHMCN